MFAFALAIKDHPVQLMDAGIGTRLRASYPIIDHTERFVAPHCLMFSNDGSLFVFLSSFFFFLMILLKLCPILL